MNEFPGILGDVAQGSLTARVFEPRHGEGHGHTHETACLNCGTSLVGPHCHQCGQRGHLHRTLGAFFHDLLHGVLHFEGKTWRTLPLLAWQPGRLTREYIDGRRASYVSPIALFLFVVFLTFAGFHVLGGGIDLGDHVTLNGKKASVEDAQAQLNGEIARAEAKRAAALAAHQSVTAIDSDLAALRRGLATTEAIRHHDVSAFARQVAPRQELSTASAASWIASTWRKAQANPELLLFKIENDAYKYSWLLIPISVPFVWVLFPFSRRFRLYDHTVFVTYSLSFMMLILLVGALGARLEFAPLVMIPVLYAPVHMYRQLRGTYEISRTGAALRTLALLLFAAIALTLWALALLGMLLGQ